MFENFNVLCTEQNKITVCLLFAEVPTHLYYFTASIWKRENAANFIFHTFQKYCKKKNWESETELKDITPAQGTADLLGIPSSRS